MAKSLQVGGPSDWVWIIYNYSLHILHAYEGNIINTDLGELSLVEFESS